MSTPTPARRTKRRYANELYPPPHDGPRPLEVEVPYLCARAIGLETDGTDWYELFTSPDQARKALALARISELCNARHMALLADALLQGMCGQEAWAWADERAGDEAGEFVYDRAVHYGVPVDRIRPYPVLAEAATHNHWTEPDSHGWRTLVGHIKVPESACEDCTEPVPDDVAPLPPTTDTKESS